MRHFFTNRVRAVLLIAVLLAIVLAVVSSLTGMQLPRTIVQSVLAPFRAGVSKLAERSQQLYSYMFEYETLLAENEALKEQLAAIEDEARDAYATKQENDRLRRSISQLGTVQSEESLASELLGLVDPDTVIFDIGG